MIDTTVFKLFEQRLLSNDSVVARFYLGDSHSLEELKSAWKPAGGMTRLLDPQDIYVYLLVGGKASFTRGTYLVRTF